uniref:Uncharacterized protein n=1 Tax=Panagrolaimus sp. ES5 TaxID=591445 RepID=A0AC34GNU7_9BILA
MEKLLYQDKFAELYHDKIILKCYYFPTTKSKTIYLNEIQYVYYDTQENSMVFTIGWGMTIFGVWWGLDLKRQFPSFKTKYSNVIFDCGSGIKSGFTVVDIDEFLKVLEPLLTKSTVLMNIISDKFEATVKTATPIKHVSSKKSEKCISWKTKEATEKEEADQFKYHFDNFYTNKPLPSYEEALKNCKFSSK